MYKKNMINCLKNYNNLNIEYNVVDDIILNNKNDKIVGVRLGNGEIIATNKVIITTGTFLRGEIHIGTNGFKMIIRFYK